MNINEHMRGLQKPGKICAAPAAALILTGAAGCIGDLDTRSSVHDLRILAIQATPPEVHVMDAAAAGEQTFHLEVLAPDIAGGVPAGGERHYRAALCPKLSSGRCALPEDEVVLAEGTYDGDGFGVTFTLGVENAALLLKTLEEDPWHGFGGLPLPVTVKVWNDRGEEEHAFKEIILQIPRLSVEGEPDNENPPPPVLLDADGAPLAEAGVPVPFPGEWKIDVDPTARDARPRYNVPTYSGGTLSIDESWTYQWFSTRGTFAPETTGGLNPVTGEAISAVTTLTTHKKDGPGEMTVWCVLRDGRGGVSWTRFTGNAEADESAEAEGQGGDAKQK